MSDFRRDAEDVVEGSPHDDPDDKEALIDRVAAALKSAYFDGMDEGPG